MTSMQFGSVFLCTR